MNIFQRWKQTAIHNKALVVTSILVAFGTLFYAGAAVVQVCIMKESARESSNQANRLIQAANLQVDAANKLVTASKRNADAAESFAGEAKKQAMQITTQAAATQTLAAQALGQSNISRRALELSQRAYVTIGRKDGIVADFVVPKDPQQNAEIVIFFQNSGHLPAKFAWGTTVSFLGQGSTKNSGITLTHPYQGLSPRTRNKKDGSTGESGESSVIAGDSVFIATLGTISQKDLAELPTHTPSLLIMGMFQYCDEVGDWYSKMFGLRFRANAPISALSFDLANVSDFGPMPPPETTAETEYFPPCWTAPREQRKNAGLAPRIRIP